jgi:hypothetical protein
MQGSPLQVDWPLYDGMHLHTSRHEDFQILLGTFLRKEETQINQISEITLEPLG